MPLPHSRGWYRVALLLVGATGCSGSDADDDADGASSSKGGVSTEADFLSRFPDLACASFESCCIEAGYGYDATLCHSFLTPFPDGSLTFDPEAATECLNALENATECTDGSGVPACNRVYTGSAATGEACSADADCAQPEQGSASCDLRTSVCTLETRGTEGQACDASCQTIGSSGWVCSGGSDGPEEVRCWREDGLICREGSCQALGGPGDPCSFDDDCVDDAFCDAAGSCQARVGAGGSCDGSECVTGTYCSETCLPQLAEGQPCTLDEECLGGSCDDSACGADAPLGGLAGAFLGFLCGG